MLRRGLKSVCWDAVPQETQLELERFNRANVQKILFSTGELIRLIGLFQQNDIPIAAFKGAVLAASIYSDLSLREFVDLDILVEQSYLSKAEDLLSASGYQAQFPDRDYRSAFLSHQGQYAFRHRQTEIVIDLHWCLSSKGVAFPLESAEVWPRLEQVTIGGRMVPTLGRDELVLFLAAHGTKEGWRKLIWVCDFAELLRKGENTDWGELLDRAHRAHSARPLLLAFLLASTLLEAPAPAELINKARKDSAVQALAEEARFRMLRTTPLGELGEFVNSLKTHDQLRHRLWPVATLLTTRTVGDYEAMPLPKFLWGMYYVTRPFRRC